MDLEKAFDQINRKSMWQMLRVYGVGGKLLKVVQSFDAYSRACVQIRIDVSEWFPVNVGLRESCVMYPWLFNVYTQLNIEVLFWKRYGDSRSLSNCYGVVTQP